MAGVLDAGTAVSFKSFISFSEDRLKAAGVEDAGKEGALMLAHLYGVRPSDVFLRRAETVEETFLGILNGWVERRIKREPLQYILGETEFRGLTFKVNPSVLIPRPETERVVEETLSAIKGNCVKNPAILDLCTGSGCIVVSLAKELPGARLVASDNSKDAVSTAKVNAALNDVAGRIEFFEGDLFSALPEGKGPFDIIVSNPPYVETLQLAGLQPELSYEPAAALDGGMDGLYFIEKIIKGATAYLKPGGRLIMEIGFGQGDGVKGLFKENTGYAGIEIKKDYCGVDRVVKAKRRG